MEKIGRNWIHVEVNWLHSFFYKRFFYFDLNDISLSEKILHIMNVKYKINGTLEKEGSDYSVVEIDIKKNDTNVTKFLNAMDKLYNYTLLYGHKDYPQFCEEIIAKITKE